MISLSVDDFLRLRPTSPGEPAESFLLRRRSSLLSCRGVDNALRGDPARGVRGDRNVGDPIGLSLPRRPDDVRRCERRPDDGAELTPSAGGAGGGGASPNLSRSSDSLDDNDAKPLASTLNTDEKFGSSLSEPALKWCLESASTTFSSDRLLSAVSTLSASRGVGFNDDDELNWSPVIGRPYRNARSRGDSTTPLADEPFSNDLALASPVSGRSAPLDDSDCSASGAGFAVDL